MGGLVGWLTCVHAAGGMRGMGGVESGLGWWVGGRVGGWVLYRAIFLYLWDGGQCWEAGVIDWIDANMRKYSPWLRSRFVVLVVEPRRRRIHNSI